MDTVNPGPPFLAGDHPVAMATRAEAARAFWTSVWLGTAVAGGVFGLCVAGAPGLFYGIAAAGIVALPTQLTAAAVVWALECPRFRVALAGGAGAATGILASVLTYDAAVYDVPFSSAIVLAAGIGMLGAALAGTLSRNAIRRRLRNLAFSGQRRRHFSFLGSLLRLLVLGGLVAAWVLGGRAVWTARQNALRIVCQDRLGQIWEALEAYHRKHGALPPPAVTDSQGRPVLSWRVLAAEERYHDQDFRTGLDSSQPWNSPRNAQFLGELDADWLRCPGASAARPGVTQYLAVVGPDTLWAGDIAGQAAHVPRAAAARGRMAPQRHSLGRASRPVRRRIPRLVPRAAASRCEPHSRLALSGHNGPSGRTPQEHGPPDRASPPDGRERRQVGTPVPNRKAE